MNASPLPRQTHLLTLLLFSLGILIGPLGVAPEAEAAGARDKKKLKKLKKQSNALRFTIMDLQAQLAAARRPVIVPDPVPFIEMVTVGNPGNGTDAGNPLRESVFGAVPYEFSIGKYEVTNTQYVVFLNAVAAMDTYSLYSADMGSDARGGITQFGASPNFGYAVRAAMDDKPVNYVNWFDAARFCNWLHNGRPTGAQDAGTTEAGAYALNGATSGLAFYRVWAAKYWIPSEDEWYKAAYHQPSGQGGDSDDYWLYPTGSNTRPGNDIGPLPLANHANSRTANDFYSVTQSESYDANQNYLTDGGAFGGSGGFYGTFDMGGNVWEWNDAEVGTWFGSFRGLRGGSWDDAGVLQSSRDQMRSSVWNEVDPYPDNEVDHIGFRVASP